MEERTDEDEQALEDSSGVKVVDILAIYPGSSPHRLLPLPPPLPPQSSSSGKKRKKRKKRKRKKKEDEQALHQRYLPHHLIAHHILTRVPIKPLFRFKCVSKEWYSTVSSSYFDHNYPKSTLFNPSSPIQYLFIQNRSKYYLLSLVDGDDHDIGAPTYVNKNLFELSINSDAVPDEELILIGSCNGLICLAYHYFFFLWNPITGKCRKYLDLELEINSLIPFRVSWGFGYVSSVDDFKVVRVLQLQATLEIRVDVFSLKSNKWTRIADELHQDLFSLRSRTDDTTDPPEFPYTFLSFQGVLVNETLYWVVSKEDGLGRNIVAFNLVSEVFDANVDLELISNAAYDDKFICNMGGCLSKCGCNIRGDYSINILKYPGKVESISLYRDLELKTWKDLVGFTGTGKFFILSDLELGLVDPSSIPKYTCLLTLKRSPRSGYIASYVPSLTLPWTW